MFVSVFVGKGRTSLYECRRVHIRPDETNEGQVFVCMEDSDVNLVVEKATTLVYIMNNEGKTIDTHRWS